MSTNSCMTKKGNRYALHKRINMYRQNIESKNYSNATQVKNIALFDIFSRSWLLQSLSIGKSISFQKLGDGDQIVAKSLSACLSSSSLTRTVAVRQMTRECAQTSAQSTPACLFQGSSGMGPSGSRPGCSQSSDECGSPVAASSETHFSSPHGSPASPSPENSVR